jgi:phosphate transport system protein
MLDLQLMRVQDEVLVLGSMVEHALLDAVEALRRHDQAAAKRIITADRAINSRRFAIEEDCLALIAMQQPIARDLRVIAAILEIVTELERIGDYAKGISKINLLIGRTEFIKPLVDIPLMAIKATDMLRRALSAFVRRDVEMARAIPREDDEVDALYNQIYRELLALILSDPHNIDQATHLLWAAHNLERAADRVTNICERTVFMAIGKMTELDESEGIDKAELTPRRAPIYAGAYQFVGEG